MQLHLDLMGGLAGDMFIATVLDAFPEHTGRVTETIARLAATFEPGAPPCRVVAHNDGVFEGRRFEVGAPNAKAVDRSDGPRRHGHGHGHDHAHDHGHDHQHDHDQDHDHATPTRVPGHVAWRDIRERLERSLDGGTLGHAVGIFTLLAQAEASVHGVPVDAVEFHEVGAWDSVADIVGAACLIDAVDARRWTVSAVPLGFGRVVTAHGPMPVPPPATALLLQGFETLDDGIGGERVTPTGAAILKYLMPEGHPIEPRGGSGGASGAGQRRRLRRTGVGFGTRRLASISNCVRLLVFDDEAASLARPEASQHRELSVIEFEVDDQSLEELSMGLQRLREHEAVFDVVQMPVFGKKGRMMSSIRLLCRPSALDGVIDACFRETTTIGLRHSSVRAAALPRRFAVVEVGGHRLRVKVVERPGGATAKAESDDALKHETQQARRAVRAAAEKLALDATPGGTA